jgi:tripartite ATP-independent transporter DctM subunit
MLIPPSVVFIVYAIMTEQSVGQLFMAGIVPGILIALLFCGCIYLQCRRRPDLGPRAVPSGWKEKGKALAGVAETLILFTVVIGGMFAGLFTPTEAASIGAGGTLLLAVLQRRLSWRSFFRSLQETVRTSCMVLIIVAGAVMFGHFLAVTRIPYELAAWLVALPLPAWAVISVIILFYLIAGCFIDALGLILLTIPIFYPVVEELGYNLIWFGVIIVLVTQMGVISPPVGVNAYVVSGMERDIALQTVFRGVIPFLLCLLIAAGLLVAFPGICLWLPALVK